MKSMERSSRIRPASGSRSSVVHGVGRVRESELRERESDGVGAGWVEEDGLAFNAAYGVAGEELDGRHVAATDDPRSRSR